MKAFKPIRIILISFSFLLLLVISSYIFWPFWSPKALHLLLVDTQFRVEHANISRPGFTSLDVSNLNLVYSKDENQINISAERLDIKYTLESLLKGELVSISSDFIDVKFRQNSTQNSVASGSFSPSLILPSQLFEFVPVERVEVSKIKVTSPLVTEYSDFIGHLSFNPQQFDLFFSSQKKPSFSFLLKANKENEINLVFEREEKRVVDISSKIETLKTDNQLLASAHIDIAGLALLAKHLDWLDQDINADGKMDVSLQLVLPQTFNKQTLREIPINGSVNIRGEVSKAQGNMAAHYAIETDIQGNSENITLLINQLDMAGELALPPDISEMLIKTNKEQPILKPFVIGTSSNTELEILAVNSGTSFNLKKGKIEASLGSKKGSLYANMKMNTLSYKMAGTWLLESKFQARAKADSISLPGLRVKAADSEMSGKLSASVSGVELSVNKGSGLNAKYIQTDKGLISSLNIRSMNKLNLSLENEAINFSNALFDIKLPEFSWDNQHFTMQSAQLTLDHWFTDAESQNKNSIIGKVAFEDINTKKEGVRLTPLMGGASINVKGNVLTGQHHIQDQTGLIQLNGQFEQDLLQGQGSLNVTLQPIVFTEDDTYLPKMIERWRYPLDLSAGNLSLSTKFSWQRGNVTSNTVIKFTDVAGFYERNLFTGMNGTLKLKGAIDNPKVMRQTFSIEGVDVGVPVRNVEFTIGGTLEELHIQNLRAELLGGTVSQKDIIYRWKEPKNRLNLQLENIQLAEILKLETGIFGEGELNGHLPISLLANGVEVEDGKIDAVTHGIIRYQTDVPIDSAVSNSGVTLALDALENFHYDVLDINANYSEAGDMLLKIALQGRNPDLKEKRPFHFNLQIRENIPALLKSLQLTQKISDSIDKRVKALYKQP